MNATAHCPYAAPNPRRAFAAIQLLITASYGERRNVVPMLIEHAHNQLTVSFTQPIAPLTLQPQLDDLPKPVSGLAAAAR